MCGIAGIVHEDPEVRARVHDMVACLGHRGPDDRGTEFLDGVALGHTRLSVIDPERGRQPMLGPSGSTTIVYNGEIYNFEELRRGLAARGRTFRTDSDTEVLLHLYEVHGIRCVERLEGMFAFAIWDADRRRLFLARDHLGQKPLFWIERDEVFAFASEIKALLRTGLVEAELNLEGLYHHVSLRCLPDDLTLFRGVRSLAAGHVMVREEGRHQLRRYWSPSFQDKERGSDAELAERLHAELSRTVASHLVADVPVGSFLSGGIDSSLITALAALRKSEQHTTFSIGVRERSFDELPYARDVASRYGTDHHERRVSADLVGLLPQITHHMEEPADPFAVGVYLAADLASQHRKVVLSGDGGDELFAGYDRYLGQQLAELYALIPGWTRKHLLRPLIERVPETFRYKSLAQKLLWLDRVARHDGGRRYAHAMSFLRFTETAKHNLFTPEARRRTSALDSRDKVLEHFDAEAAGEGVDRMLYTDLMTRIPGHLLPIVDRMAMAHGLEVRSPLLEHRFVDFASRLPTRMKLRGRTLKYGLREVSRRYLPAEIVDRPKQGLGFPLGRWFSGPLRPVLDGAIRDSRLIEDQVFDRGYVERLRTEHLSGEQDHSYRLWVILSVEVWYRRFLDGRSSSDVAAWLSDLEGRERIRRTRTGTPT